MKTVPARWRASITGYTGSHRLSRLAKIPSGNSERNRNASQKPALAVYDDDQQNENHFSGRSINKVRYFTYACYRGLTHHVSKLTVKLQPRAASCNQSPLLHFAVNIGTANKLHRYTASTN